VGVACDPQHQDLYGSLIQANQVKKTGSLVAVLLITLLACSFGCNKSASSGQKPQTLEAGMAQLQAALTEANAVAQSNFYNSVSSGIRYGNYVQALEGMDRVNEDPTLNSQQKKVANDLMDLLKAAAQKQQNAPAPAQ